MASQPQQQPQPLQQQGAFVTMTPPVASYQVPSNEPPRHRYKAGAGKTTGYLQIFSGVVSMMFGVISLLTLFGIIPDPALHWGHLIFAIVAWPIWSGLIFLIAGSLGASAKPGNRCVITAYMVMSIIAATLATGQLIWESIGAAVSKCYGHYYYYDGTYYGCPKPMVSYGMHVGSVLAAVLEIISAICGAAFCCHGLCCSANSTPTVVHQVQYHNAVVTQAGQYPQGQTPGALYPIMPTEYAPPGYTATPDHPVTVASAPTQAYMAPELPKK